MTLELRTENRECWGATFTLRRPHSSICPMSQGLRRVPRLVPRRGCQNQEDRALVFQTRQASQAVIPITFPHLGRQEGISSIIISDTQDPWRYAAFLIFLDVNKGFLLYRLLKLQSWNDFRSSGDQFWFPINSDRKQNWTTHKAEAQEHTVSLCFLDRN